jgi:predicted nucleotide-binding protein
MLHPPLTMKSERYSFPEVKELKPLLANLLRAGIAKYLTSDAFQQLLIEFDLEEDWRACTKITGMTKNSRPEEFGGPFFLLLSIIDKEFKVGDELRTITNIIQDFVRWSPTEIDLRSVKQALKELDIDDSLARKFASSVKKLNKGKTNGLISPQIESRSLKKVFVVHGHEMAAVYELEKILKEEFQLTPVIMQEMPNEGVDTIISKFERLAADCEVAIALLTPDDITKLDKYRARQNVILEVGYFLGRERNPQKRRIIILKKGDVESPSDLNGVIEMRYVNSIKEKFKDLRDQLRHWKVVSM